MSRNLIRGEQRRARRRPAQRAVVGRAPAAAAPRGAAAAPPPEPAGMRRASSRLLSFGATRANHTSRQASARWSPRPRPGGAAVRRAAAAGQGDEAECHIVAERLDDQAGPATARGGDRRAEASGHAHRPADRDGQHDALDRGDHLRPAPRRQRRAQPGQQSAGSRRTHSAPARSPAPTRRSRRRHTRSGRGSGTRRPPCRSGRPAPTPCRCAGPPCRRPRPGSAPPWSGPPGSAARPAGKRQSAISAATPPTSVARTRVTRLAGPEPGSSGPVQAPGECTGGDQRAGNPDDPPGCAETDRSGQCGEQPIELAEQAECRAGSNRTHRASVTSGCRRSCPDSC